MKRVDSIGDIIEEVIKARSKQDKLDILRRNNHPAFQQFLKIAYDENIKWILAEGAPPYTPNPHLDCEGHLYKELKRLYLFVEGGNPNLSQLRRELLFIQLLENVTPSDAKILIDLKDKKIPLKLRKKIVEEALPGIFN